MNRSELAQIVSTEGLDEPVIDGAGRLHNDAVVLESGNQQWRVYLVDERNQIVEPTLRRFDTESLALEHVLLKLRQVATARRAVEEMRARRSTT